MTEDFENFNSIGGQACTRVDPLADALGRPDEVLLHPTLTKAEKRAILAAYASDVRAVKGDPALRQLDNGEIVEVDEIMQALQALDESGSADTSPSLISSCARGRRLFKAARWRWRRTGRRNGPDDDDNQPPPCPAAAYPRPSLAHAFDKGRPEWA